MEIKVLRKIYTGTSTIGELSIDGKFFCYTLEDVCRDVNRNGIKDAEEIKEHGKTAIWAGRYEVILNVSNRFKVLMPLLLNVPHFAGIRIHNGNTAEHTEGCILVGDSKSANFIGNSKVTFARLMVLLKNAAKKESIFITIVNIGS